MNDTSPGAALALVQVDKMSALEVFAPEKVETLIQRIEREARAAAKGLEPSTPEGRDAIASLAYQVAKRKTALDGLGKRMTEEDRDRIKRVNAERNIIVERLDALKTEIRQPVTDWENRDKARIEEIERQLFRLANFYLFDADEPTAEQIDIRINGSDGLKAFFAGIDWQEFKIRARMVHDETFDILDRMLRTAKKREEDAAELAALRAAKAEQDRLDYYRGMITHIKGCALGFIGPDPQPIALCLYELQSKIKIDETWGEFEEPARQELAASIAHIEHITAELDRKAAERRAQEDALLAQQAAERAQREAEERARQAAEAQAQRVEQERQAAAAAAEAAQREADRKADEALRLQQSAESARLAILDGRVQSFRKAATFEPTETPTAATIRGRIYALADQFNTHDFQERQEEAAAAVAEGRATLDAMLAEAEQREAHAAEQDLRRREADILRQDREKRATEQAATDKEAEKRANDKKHRGAINRGARDALILCGLTEQHATAAVEAIERGDVPRVRIEY